MGGRIKLPVRVPRGTYRGISNCFLSVAVVYFTQTDHLMIRHLKIKSSSLQVVHVTPQQR